jgi:ubiquinone/menaquinone biosynthesis C-methylase UbiE
MNDRKTRDYYRIRAAEYEQIYYRHVPERRREIEDESERLKSFVSGRTVLELACGTGYWTEIMADTARSIVALDIWMEMLAEARKKKYKSRVDFVRADMLHPPVKADSFDMVAVGFWFSHQPRQAYEEFFECLRYPLKKNGRIWMIDNNPPAEGRTKESVRVDEYGNNFKKRCLDDGREFVILKNYFEEEELKNILSPVFKIERLVYKNYYWSVQLTL